MYSQQLHRVLPSEAALTGVEVDMDIDGDCCEDSKVGGMDMSRLLLSLTLNSIASSHLSLSAYSQTLTSTYTYTYMFATRTMLSAYTLRYLSRSKLMMAREHGWRDTPAASAHVT